MKFTKNLLQVWSDVFPEVFSPQLSTTSSSKNTDQQHLIEFFALSNNHDPTTNGRRQRNETETVNTAAATPSAVLYLEQLSSIHGRVGDDCAPDIISGIENQILSSLSSSKKKDVSILPKHSCNSSLQRKMVESTLTAILSGKSACVVHEHFSLLAPGDEETVANNSPVKNVVENVIQAKATCYRVLALSCLLHTMHQPPSLVAVEATRKNEKFPIALIITSSPQNSIEIASALRKIEIEEQGWSESPSSSSLVRNLDDDFEILNWQQNENSSGISITNILIGSAQKVAEILQDQNNTNSNATTSSSKIVINTSKISFVWIDELDVILSSSLNHYSQANQNKNNSTNNNIPLVLANFMSNLSFPQFIFSLFAPLRADDRHIHSPSPNTSDRIPVTMQTFLHAASHTSSPCIFIQPKWVRNRNLHVSSAGSNNVTLIYPQTSLLLWNIPNYSGSETTSELGEFFDIKLKPHLQKIVSPSAMAYLRLHPQQFTISEFAKYFFGFPTSSSSSSFLYRCRGCVLMKFASEKERNAAYRKFSGKRLGEIFSSDHEDDKFAVCCPMMILPSASPISAKIVDGFIVFESTPSSSVSSFLFDKQVHVVLRNAVKSIIDVWPSPSNSRVAKSIESLILRANTKTTSATTKLSSTTIIPSVSNFGFYWWVTNNLQQCYSLASDGATGKDCLENESSADGSYVFHDEVRLVVTLPSFSMACEFIDGLMISSVSSQQQSNSNSNMNRFSNEGFKLGKRQVVAHFVTSSESREVNDNNNNHGGESRYKLFSPNQELDPEVDADFLALETDDE